MDETLPGPMARGCAAIGWQGTGLGTRCLTAAQVTHSYLPLRYDVLHRELHWTVHDVRRPEDLRDGYDAMSVAFGVFEAAGRLIGASRLIMSGDAYDLPSTRLLLWHGRRPHFPTPVAEISRVMVRRECRNLGLFRILLFSGLFLADGAGIRTVILTERDDVRAARVMVNSGFARFAEGFSFVDETIAPNEPAATYVLDARSSLGPDVRGAIAAHREVLLRAADGLFTAARAERAGNSGRG